MSSSTHAAVDGGSAPAPTPASASASVNTGASMSTNPMRLRRPGTSAPAAVGGPTAHAELSSAAKAKLEKVERISGEYVSVMMLLGNMDVLSVYKVRNEEVDLQFVIAVSGAEQMEMVKVLHGTTTESVDLIVQQGFKVGGVDVPVRHGTALGKGVYLTTSSQLATSYSNNHQCKYVILSELCVTPDTKLNSHLRGRRKRQPAKNDVYVQPDKTLVRPLYVAEFRYVAPNVHNCIGRAPLRRVPAQAPFANMPNPAAGGGAGWTPNPALQGPPPVPLTALQTPQQLQAQPAIPAALAPPPLANPPPPQVGQPPPTIPNTHQSQVNINNFLPTSNANPSAAVSYHAAE